MKNIQYVHEKWRYFSRHCLPLSFPQVNNISIKWVKAMCWEAYNILVCMWARDMLWLLKSWNSIIKILKNELCNILANFWKSNLTCSIQCQQYMNSYDNNYTPTILTLIILLSLPGTISGSFIRHNFHTVLAVLPSVPDCSWMYNSSGKMKAIFVRMKFFKPKNLSHSFTNQVR